MCYKSNTLTESMEWMEFSTTIDAELYHMIFINSYVCNDNKMLCYTIC